MNLKWKKLEEEDAKWRKKRGLPKDKLPKRNDAFTRLMARHKAWRAAKGLNWLYNKSTSRQ